MTARFDPCGVRKLFSMSLDYGGVPPPINFNPCGVREMEQRSVVNTGRAAISDVARALYKYRSSNRRLTASSLRVSSIR